MRDSGTGTGAVVGVGSTERNRGTRPLAAVGAAAVLLGLLAGCAGPAAAPADPSPNAEQPSAAEPSAEPVEESWERFTDPRIPHSFELPPAWTVVELGADPGTDSYLFGVLNPEGEEKLQFSNRAQGMGGSCGPADPVLEIEELESHDAELPGYVAAAPNSEHYQEPRVAFLAAPVDGRVVASLSLADDEPVAGCMRYNLLQVDQGPALFTTNIQLSTFNLDNQWVFESMDDARAYTATEEYEQLVRVLSSLSFVA